MRYVWMIAMLLAVVTAEAQPPRDQAAPPVHGGPGLARPMNDATRELLEQVMMARVSKELALDEPQTVLLVRAFTEFRDQMAELRRHRNQILNDLKNLIREGKDNAAIQSKLDTLIAHDERVAAARRELYERAGADLTPWQRAKLYVFMSDFEAEVRRLVKKAQERVNRIRLEGDPGLRPPGRPGRPGPGPFPPGPGPDMPPRPPEPAPAP